MTKKKKTGVSDIMGIYKMKMMMSMMKPQRNYGLIVFGIILLIISVYIYMYPEVIMDLLEGVKGG